MMRDFTIDSFTLLLDTLLAQGYAFQTVAEYMQSPAEKVVVLRHDIDARKKQALLFATLEQQRSVKGTFYFRVVPESWDEKIITAVHNMGHEVGYHYEDIDIVRKQDHIKDHQKEWSTLSDRAWKHFQQQLSRLRELSPVTTVCMHGSPLSPVSNRKLLEEHDYKALGITCEPYLDLDFSQLYYLTDTGRRWDGQRVSIRDKVDQQQQKAFQQLMPRTTKDIITLIENRTMPEKVMITLHPQRWSDKWLQWMKELVWQRVKNVVKRVLLWK
ncbi:MAG: hypothetical protein RQ866_06135 [Bacteroidales bacterium]|nr:hypothetical protein [Bacteroidales bacterium]